MTSNQFIDGRTLLRTSGEISDVFPTIGHRGMAVWTAFHNPTTNLGGAGNAYRIVIEWASDPAFSHIVASRQFVVAAGAAQGGFTNPTYGRASMTTPHYGDFVRFTLYGAAFTGTTKGVEIVAEHRASAMTAWLPPNTSGVVAGDTFLNTYALIPFSTSTVVAAGATFSARAAWPYEGPALVTYRGNFNAAAVGDWQLLLFSEDEAGVGNRLATWQAVPGTIYTAHLTELVIVSPGILLLQAINGTAANKSMSIGLTADYSRQSA